MVVSGVKFDYARVAEEVQLSFHPGSNHSIMLMHPTCSY